MNIKFLTLLPFLSSATLLCAQDDSFMSFLPEPPPQMPSEQQPAISVESESKEENPRVVQYNSANNWGLPSEDGIDIKSEVSPPDMANDQFATETNYPRRNGNAKALINAFIASIAGESPWLKKQHARYREDCEPGVVVGYSKGIGKFTYRPKIWDDLTEGQQQLVIKDPRLKAFLISMRNPENHPKTEWNYGKTERGTYSAEGYAEAEVAKMREIVESLKAEQRILVSEMKAAIADLKGDVGSIKTEQAILLGDINLHVVGLKLQQDEALADFATEVLAIQDQQDSMINDLNATVDRLQDEQTTAITLINSNIETLKSAQSGIMDELNTNVELAIAEHHKIIVVLKSETASLNGEWNEARKEIIDMMNSAKPIDVIVNSPSLQLGPAQVDSSSGTMIAEPLYKAGGLLVPEQTAAYVVSNQPIKTTDEVKAQMLSTLDEKNKNRQYVMPKPSPTGARFVLQVPAGQTTTHYTITVDGDAFIRGELL